MLSSVGLFFIPEILDSKEETLESNKGVRTVRVKLKVKYNIFAENSLSGRIILLNLYKNIYKMENQQNA
mgnify:CR=1 FL=1